MTGPRPNHPPRTSSASLASEKNAPAAARRGVAVLWVILALPVLVILVCVVVEIGNQWLARAELDDALEAAALAAVKEWAETNGVGGTLPARGYGVSYAGANTMRGSAVMITGGDLVFGAITSTNPDTVFDAGTVPSHSGGGRPKLFTCGAISGPDWKTVTTGGNVYTQMVVVATPVFLPDAPQPPPRVVRIRNANPNSTSFQFVVQNVQTGAFISDVPVQFMVVEQGAYTPGLDGVKMEAYTYNSTVTDNIRSWVGTTIAPSPPPAPPGPGYSNMYIQPVVLGQVMSYNDPNWSVFWASGANRSVPPDATNLRVGKHVGEDTNTIRMDETVGYIVIEADSGNIGGIPYAANLGPDTVRAINDGPPFNYTLPAGLNLASTAIVTKSAEDGGNGAWAYLYDCDAIRPQGLKLSLDEDQIADPERNHTAEPVAYIVFDNPPFAVTAQKTLDVPSICGNLLGISVGPFQVSARATAFYDCHTGRPQLIHVDQYNWP